MQELRLVAVSEDGTYLVLATAGRGTRFTLPVDDRLRAAVRGHFSRLGQFEIEVESPLRPKEIQARIRSGETAEEIAESAGIPVERIRWFEGPVLQEREYMAQQAQRVTVRRPGESTPGPPLGETVEERLGRGGVDLEEVEWDSWKCEDGTWRVRLSFFDDGRPHAAEWTFDPRRRHVFPLDEIAARLTAVEWDDDALSDTVTPLVPRRPAMKVVSNDRDPAARGLPGEPVQPGAHGRLRPAEPREYPAEPPRMAEPRAFREAAHEGTGIGRTPAQHTTEPGRFQDAPRQRGAAPARETGESRTAHIRETAETDRFTERTQAPEAVRTPPLDDTDRDDTDREESAREESGFDAVAEDRETPDVGEGPESDAVRTTDRDMSEERATAGEAEASSAEPELSRDVSEDRGTAQAREDAEPRDVAETNLAEDEAQDQDIAETRETVGTAETGRSEGAAQGGEVTRPREASETRAPESAGAAETADDRETADRGETVGRGETVATEHPKDTSPDRETAESRTTDREKPETAGETETPDTARTDASSGKADERAASRLAETPARRAARLRAAAEAAAEEAEAAEAAEAEAAEAAGPEPAEAPADAEAAEPAAGARDREGGPAEEEKPARESRPPAQRPGQRQPARTPAKKKPAARPTMPAAQDKPPAPAAAASSEPAAQRPARRRKSKGKRASVPSWDEIMFGARRPE
ncbi:septation protein SepH [Actinomadura sp. 6K520]|uniref:septation protein SepH n=1 Tax=Actinomadura sp. 6K520 TaxID=2530364 RepID=UPI001FB82E8C|nr:septation protein SepH [Actinomadura sp. 6K520]